MSVLIRNFLFFILVLFSSLSLIFSFNVCNTNINEPWFQVKDNLGKSVLIIDNEGDMYFEGIDHSLNNLGSYKTIEIGNSFFNRVTSKFSLVHETQTILPSSINSLIIRSNSSVEVAKFLENGQIYTKGKAIFDGSQGGCTPDGNYCNGNLLENRDYFCSLTGTQSGGCSNNILSSENCLTKLSVDSDGGVVRNIIGTVKDYSGCSGSSCIFNSYTDFCVDQHNLNEYSVNGISYNSQNIDCSSSNYYFCSGINVYLKDYRCSSGACDNGNNVFIQTCSASATSYGTWSCLNENTKVRTVITYSPICSLGSCSQTSSSSSQTQSCNVGEYCSSGNCNTITYHWDYGSWGSCIGSCGSSSGTQSRTYSCIRDYDSAVVSDSYCGTPISSQSCTKTKYPDSWLTSSWSSCGGGTCGTGTQTRSVSCSGSCCNPSTKPASSKSCNLGSCVVSHDHKSCYNGDVYWYDSSNVREEMYDDCLLYNNWHWISGEYCDTPNDNIVRDWFGCLTSETDTGDNTGSCCRSASCTEKDHYKFFIRSSCCTVTSWTPATSTKCSGTSFTQTSNCGTTRSATGTKNCCTSDSGNSCTVWGGTWYEYDGVSGITSWLDCKNYCLSHGYNSINHYCPSGGICSNYCRCSKEFLSTITGTINCKGSCIAPHCLDDCPYSGKKRCKSSQSSVTCGNYDSDSCLEYNFANSEYCSNGCNDATGSCNP